MTYLVYTQSAINGFISGMDNIIYGDSIFPITTSKLYDAIYAITKNPKTLITGEEIRKCSKFCNLKQSKIN